MFAASALAGIANLTGDSEIEDECDVAAGYADRMLAIFEDSFECESDE